MFHSPTTTAGKKGSKSGFKLDPPTLLLQENKAPEPDTNPGNETVPDSLENSGTIGSVSDLLLDDNVFHDACGSGTPTEENPGGSSQKNPSETDDPFTKLHNLMATGFTSMKSDNLVLSGQLGMLQTNVNTLNTTVATMKSDFGVINDRLNSVSSQTESNKKGIEGINKKISNLQANQSALLEEKVTKAVAKEMAKVATGELAQQVDKMSKEIDRMKAVNALHQLAGTRNTGGARSSVRSEAEDEEKQYWAARKKLRCSPVIAGPGANDLVEAAYAFFKEKLSIPAGELHESAVLDVKKIPGRRKSFAQNEVVITCDSVQTRDCIASYAANLAKWRGENESQRAGLRLEIPDNLCGVFRVLERYAHQMKGKHAFFKRSIKYDDVNLSLVLDYCTEEGGEWHRIDYSEAAQQTRGKLPSNRSSTSSAHDAGPQHPVGQSQGTSEWK